MEERNFLTLLRRRWYVLLGLCLLLLAVWLVSSYGIISVEVDGANPSQPVKYSIYSQASHSSTSSSLPATTITKIVRRASYEVIVSQNAKNAFSVVSVHGFFQKTTTTPKLADVPRGQFVGNNPGNCMYYGNTTLYSYDCSGATTITVHVPATANQPTYNLKQDTNMGTIEGTTTTSTGPIALAQLAVDEESSAAPHTLYGLSSSFKPIRSTVLAGLDANKNYSIQAYHDGFIVYNKDFTELKYYSSPSAKPQDITINADISKDQKPLALSAQGNNLLVAFSDKADVENNTNPGGIGKVKSEMFLINGDGTKKITFDKQYVYITLCGNNKLCVIDAENKQFRAYDVSGDNPKLLYSVENATSFKPFDKKILVVRDKDILSLDPDSGEGFVAYAYGAYSGCGLETAASSYLICLTGVGDVNAVLRVDPSNPSPNDVNESGLLELQKLAEVKTVSVYGKYLFITPNLGDVVYNNSFGLFDYDPSVKSETAKKINQVLSSSGLVKSYTATINGLP